MIHCRRMRSHHSSLAWVEELFFAQNAMAAIICMPSAFKVESRRFSRPVNLMLKTSPSRLTRSLSSLPPTKMTWTAAISGRLIPQASRPKLSPRGATIEWLPVVLADGAIVSFGSSATTPAMPYHLTENGREMIAKSALPSDFPSEQLVEPKQVTFKSDDGLEIHGQLFVPRKKPAKPGPALIFAHGGPPRQMMLGFHNMYYYHNAYAQNEYLASLGYTVLSVNYRLGIMYGAAFRRPPNSVWRGASEYKDVLAAAKYLQGLDSVDRKRIGIWGGSYGGLLTALALARNSDIFAAGVDFHGVHDWSTLLRFDIPGAESAPDYKEAMKLAYESSAVASVDKWKSPVLLIHGDDDRNVPFQQTTDLVQRLRKQNVQFEELIFPDEIHDFLLWKSWIKGLSVPRRSSSANNLPATRSVVSVPRTLSRFHPAWARRIPTVAGIMRIRALAMEPGIFAKMYCFIRGLED